MSMTDRLIPLTDDRGKTLRTPDLLTEPEPASVVLTEGEFGTTWQRFFSDGLWHSARGGRALTWEEMLTKRNLVLVYDAPVRKQGEQR